ncbi:hypothetical protein ACODYM_28710 [Burkholderia gladioli]|uniref:hypothetical protein n=1 Tax=Burkholderia gladioli TaxID=28095 RepID=UPI003B51343E
MRETVVLSFKPPFEGLDGEFNTFRPGLAMAKRLAAGHGVFLMDSKRQVVFGTALVTRLEQGPLQQLCDGHAAFNHSQLSNPDKDGASARLMQIVTKLYGPHIASPTRPSVAIYLKRIE